MATTLTITATVKAMESQRWSCLITIFQFNETSLGNERWCGGRTSVRPRQKLFQLFEELLPPGMGAAIGLLLIGPEACLLHPQPGPSAGRGECERHHALQVKGGVRVLEIPSVGQRLVRLDGEHLAIQHAAPFAAKIEVVADDRLEVALHQPCFDQMRLRKRAPEL